jgi:molecular chaperone DnaJ
MDYYSILGLAPGASLADVKRAYRRLSRRFHPGINPGDRQAEAMFQHITEAYETLVDAERRKQYDAAGTAAPPSSAAAFEFTGFDFSMKAHGPQAGTFTELFAETLHPMAPTNGATPQPGADLHASVVLSFDAAMRGVEHPLTVTRQIRCGGCRGAGVVRTADGSCPHCHGAGRVRWARGHMVFTKTCAACGGSGRERQRRCTLCGGHGRSVRTESTLVHIPAGVMDGVQLRVPERGHAGSHGGRAGDLYVHVTVEPHPVLRRDRNDLHMIVPVAVHEAALGARVEVPSFDGPVRLRVPPGTQGGQRIRISGRGAHDPAGQRGDLYIEVRLALPPIVDERSKEIMREFARLNTTDVRRELIALMAQECGDHDTAPVSSERETR